MEWSTILGMIARHLLGSAAGFLAAHGLIGADPSATEAFVGAGMALAAVAWSAWQKYGRVLVHKDIAEARNVPSTAP